MKIKLNKLDFDEMVPVPLDLSKLSNVVRNNAVKNTKYDELIKNVSNIKTTDTSDLIKKTDYNTKINEIEEKITDHDHGGYITTEDLLS